MTQTTMRASPNCNPIPWMESHLVGMIGPTPSSSTILSLQVTITLRISDQKNQDCQSPISQISSAFVMALPAVYFETRPTPFMGPS